MIFCQPRAQVLYLIVSLVEVDILLLRNIFKSVEMIFTSMDFGYMAPQISINNFRFATFVLFNLC